MNKEIETYQIDIHTLGYYLERSLWVMIKRLNKELKSAKLHLQHSDFLILKVLNVKDGLNQSDLAKLLGKERSAISKSLNALEKEGYIVRQAVNGCTNEVCLSQKGKDVIPLINSISDRVNGMALEGFSEARKKEMMENLTLIFKNISQ